MHKESCLPLKLACHERSDRLADKCHERSDRLKDKSRFDRAFVMDLWMTEKETKITENNRM